MLFLERRSDAVAIPLAGAAERVGDTLVTGLAMNLHRFADALDVVGRCFVEWRHHHRGDNRSDQAIADVLRALDAANDVARTDNATDWLAARDRLTEQLQKTRLATELQGPQDFSAFVGRQGQYLHEHGVIRWEC
ncbi:hypothetical protein BCO18430_03310 [Burkholderia contaminans]|nr:hypothetical protein BCO18430_03310 [Burkholderia contaminans]